MTSQHRPLKRWRAQIAVIGYLPILLFLVWSGLEEIDRRKGVSPSAIIIPANELPTTITNIDTNEPSFVWEESGTDAIRSIPTDWQSNWRAGNSWTNGGNFSDMPYISHSFDRYANALTASWYSFQVQPVTEYRISSQDITLTPREMNFNLSPFFASQYRIVCMIDSRQQCLAWQGWFRYGNYISRLHLVNTKDIASEDFAHLATIVDAYITREFQDRKDDYPLGQPFFLRPTMFFILMWTIITTVTLITLFLQGKASIKPVNSPTKEPNTLPTINILSQTLMILSVSIAGYGGIWAAVANYARFPTAIKVSIFAIFISLALYSWCLALFHTKLHPPK